MISPGSDHQAVLAAQQLGLHDALNMDGGSSTTFVVAGRTVMNGRSSTPRAHNGLGPIPLWDLQQWGGPRN